MTKYCKPKEKRVFCLSVCLRPVEVVIFSIDPSTDVITHPVVLCGAAQSMWLDRATAAKCYMLSARKLGIIWGDTPQYWRWIPLTDSRSVKSKPPFIHLLSAPQL